VPDVAALLPDIDRDEYVFETSREGVTVVEQEGCTNVEETGACELRDWMDLDAEGVTTTVTATAEPAGSPDPEVQKRVVHSTYTWEELGLDPQLQAHVEGRTYVYRTQDGEHFEQSVLSDGVVGSDARAVATSDGYTVFVAAWTSQASSTRILTSTDGVSFVEAPGSPLAGGSAGAGVLAGRPAVALFDREGSTSVLVGQPDGSWADLSLAESGAYGGEVTFGPLGMAAVVWEPVAGSDATVPHLVHSTDGVNLSTVSLEDELGTATPNLLGLTVTADAIFVRVGGPVDGDPNTPPVQRVLVGTPG
jgi:hypothetical protein